MLAVVLISSHQCFMIGANKGAAFLEGMFSMMLGVMMGVIARGPVLGGVIARRTARDAGAIHGWAGKRAMTVLTCLVAVFAVVACVMEPGTPPTPL